MVCAGLFEFLNDTLRRPGDVVPALRISFTVCVNASTHVGKGRSFRNQWSPDRNVAHFGLKDNPWYSTVQIRRPSLSLVLNRSHVCRSNQSEPLCQSMTALTKERSIITTLSFIQKHTLRPPQHRKQRRRPSNACMWENRKMVNCQFCGHCFTWKDILKIMFSMSLLPKCPNCGQYQLPENLRTKDPYATIQ